jgi:hypothetical protein
MEQNVPTLLVALPSAQADQTETFLLAQGISVIRAENICFAEMYAEVQFFVAAVYDESLSQEEQVSLARVMRIRWPWIRIIRRISSNVPLLEDGLFDCSAVSESQLADCIADILSG